MNTNQYLIVINIYIIQTNSFQDEGFYVHLLSGVLSYMVFVEGIIK
jgi:hypothetical protein